MRNKLGKFESVRNMTSARGNDVPNQFIITFENGILFQSYDSIICIELNDDDTLYLGKNWDYSRTTSKYRNEFLGNCTDDIRKMIKEGSAVVSEEY